MWSLWCPVVFRQRTKILLQSKFTVVKQQNPVIGETCVVSFPRLNKSWTQDFLSPKCHETRSVESSWCHWLQTRSNLNQWMMSRLTMSTVLSVVSVHSRTNRRDVLQTVWHYPPPTGPQPPSLLPANSDKPNTDRLTVQFKNTCHLNVTAAPPTSLMINPATCSRPPWKRFTDCNTSGHVIHQNGISYYGK